MYFLKCCVLICCFIYWHFVFLVVSFVSFLNIKGFFVLLFLTSLFFLKFGIWFVVYKKRLFCWIFWHVCFCFFLNVFVFLPVCFCNLKCLFSFVFDVFLVVFSEMSSMFCFVDMFSGVPHFVQFCVVFQTVRCRHSLKMWFKCKNIFQTMKHCHLPFLSYCLYTQI